VKLSGQCTDSGEGGVLESLYKGLETQNLTQENYMISACTLHALQLVVANPVMKVFGEGDLDERNTMQLLHTAYDLMSSLEPREFKEMWDHAKGLVRGVDYVETDMYANKKIAKAVLTRWWYVGCAACHMGTN
jgi:hypothetical protein